MGPITGSDKPSCLPRSFKKGGHDFLDAVIVLPSGFAVSPGIYPPYLCMETVYLSEVSYIRHSSVLERVFLKGAQFSGKSLLSWDRSIRCFSERQKIIVTFEGPLVLE